MKGQATVTVTDKNGKIKSQTTEHNVVFDIPKMLWQNSLNTQTSMSVEYPYSYMSMQEYFKDICVNDKEISTTDPFNVVVPILTGSDFAPATGIGTHTLYNSTASSIVGNQMIRRWDWPAIAQAMSVKSISLGYKDKTTFKVGSRLCPTTTLLPNGYFLSVKDPGISLYKRKSTVKFSSGKFDSDLVVSNIILSPTDPSYPPKIYLYQLKNNEFAFLSYSADITTPTTGTTYLHIITFETTGIVSSRHWALTEFGAGFSSVLPENMCCATINDKNYICINKNSTNYGIFEIPDTQTAPSAGLTGTEYVAQSSNSGIGAISDSFLFKFSYYCKALIINANNTVTIKDKCFNYYNTSSGHDFAGGIDSLRGEISFTYNKLNPLTRVNTTALNFATPIAVAQGDTLSIVYTLTAN